MNYEEASLVGGPHDGKKLFVGVGCRKLLIPAFGVELGQIEYHRRPGTSVFEFAEACDTPAIVEAR